MLIAEHISCNVYGDGVVEGKFICPLCYTVNIHTITQEYYTHIPSKRCCHNLLCSANYSLSLLNVDDKDKRA